MPIFHEKETQTIYNISTLYIGVISYQKNIHLILTGICNGIWVLTLNAMDSIIDTVYSQPFPKTLQHGYSCLSPIAFSVNINKTKPLLWIMNNLLNVIKLICVYFSRWHFFCLVYIWLWLKFKYCYWFMNFKTSPLLKKESHTSFELT